MGKCEIEQLNVALYTRVSTDEQAEHGYSLDAQLERLKAYCIARGWTVQDTYIDDGYSGRDIKRPGYKRMMDNMDKWDGILVMKSDRIHRNSMNFLDMSELLDSNGKEFASVMESFDSTTAIGRFARDMVVRVAQLESEQTGERVQIGMTQKAKTVGGILGFPCPFGYRFSADGRLLVKRGESKIVRELFSGYIAGKSFQELADKLNNDGVKPINSDKWNKQTIGGMLKNPIYAGWMSWDGIVYRGTHTNLVTVTVFNRVQRKISRSVRGKRVKPKLLEK